MGSAGKWVLGLLLLVVGAVFVARAVSSDPASQATVKNNLQADPASVAKENAAAEAAKQKKIASTTAGDVACKKSCIEVNEVSNDSITTAKLAPGSVTLSKLAFEVPNLNELENEINARKAAEAQAKVAVSDAQTANAKNDAAITAAASNGITAEAAARTSADDQIVAATAAADAGLLSKLNTEITNRSAADDVLQAKLNTEISDRTASISGLRAELINPNQVASPIVQINNNEIVANAVTTDKIFPDTILANDLATGSVTTDEILDDTVAAVDLANNAVVGRATAGDPLTNVKQQTLRGERNNNGTASTSAGDLAVGTITGQQSVNAGAATGNIARETITGEGDNTARPTGSAIGNLGLQTVGRNNLVDDAVDSGKILDTTIGAADLGNDSVVGGLGGDVKDESITADDIKDTTIGAAELGNDSVVGGLGGDVKDGTLTADDLATSSVVGGLAGDVLDGSISSDDLGDNSVTSTELADGAVNTGEITNGQVFDVDLDPNGILKSFTDFKNQLVNDEPGATAPKEPNDGDGLVHWNNLEGVPNSVLNADNNVNNFKADLKTGDGSAPNTGDNLVSWENLADVPADFVDGDVSFSELSGTISAAQLGADSVVGGNAGSVKDGSITADDLATDSVDSAEIKTDAVGTAEVADNSLTAADLADNSVDTAELVAGSVKTSKQTANASSGFNGAPALLATGTDVPAVANLIVNDSAAHRVLLTGQAVVACTCAPGDTLTVSYQLVDLTTGAPVVNLMPPMSVVLTNQLNQVPISVSAVASAPPTATPATDPHSYAIRVLSVPTGTAVAIAPSGAGLTMVDLGRA